MSEQADVSDIAEAVRNHLDGADWDVAIFLTDHPRRARLYPIGVGVDTPLGAALISLAALGSAASAAFGAGVRQAVPDANVRRCLWTTQRASQRMLRQMSR